MGVQWGWFRTAAMTAGIFGLAGAAAQAQEIKFWTLSFDNPSMAKSFESIIKDFETANPGVTVKLESRGTDEHKSALRVAGGSDQAPDIYFMWAGLGLGGEFIKSGLAAPMDKYYAQYKWDDEFIAPALAFSKQYGEHRYGLPFTFRGEALYYNKALFQKAGIDSEPKTYDELLADADKLAAKGIPAITFGGTVNWHVMRLMDEILEVKCGPEKHDALTSMKVSWADEPCATASFEEMHKWSSKYFLKPFMGIDQGQSFNLFLAGRAAMMLEGNWLVGQLRNANKLADYGLFPFPDATRLYGFAEYNYISTKSKNPDLAAKFLDYFEFDARPAGEHRPVRRRRQRQQERQVDQHGAARPRLEGDLRKVQRRLRQRRPGVPARRHDGVFPRHQRCRQRPSRPEGGRRRTAEVHRCAQVSRSFPGRVDVAVRRRPGSFLLHIGEAGEMTGLER